MTYGGYHKCDKVCVVPASYAVVDPLTMMVAPVHAIVTLCKQEISNIFGRSAFFLHTILQ